MPWEATPEAALCFHMQAHKHIQSEQIDTFNFFLKLLHWEQQYGKLHDINLYSAILNLNNRLPKLCGSEYTHKLRPKAHE